ncbi:MAG: TIGR03617 family F420-dependent LLM class oxidoreductase [Chloroflexi bacterium]|nr:TIGR03617 family F420-dependent LLM class oxidoreductase [Chloroflexota bacterium]MCY4248137.1 TIGR03617 family F420-dependent LLM class oxidoreductase [Chloroflexota bacterium]
MRFEVSILSENLNAVGKVARMVEADGFAGIWLAETANNPFLPLAHAALATERISLGTAVAIAFPRSPMTMAQTAWDLAEQSRGRFVLGLGTQVKPHIEKRFSARWGKPVQQLRDYIKALRAIWRSFQTGEPLRYRGGYYQCSLPTPFSAPPPMPWHEIPIYIAGVNTGLARLAGELCDGFHVHSYHTPRYLREVLLPAFQQGRAKSQLGEPLQRSSAVFVVTGENRADIEASKIMTKSQIAFYASTPSYRPLLDLHGWADLAPRLNTLLRRGKWNELHRLISDDMLAEFAIIAPPDELPYRLRERYDGLLDRAGFYFPYDISDSGKRLVWQHAAKALAR